jgi:signal transduction histidine kinase
MAKRLQVLIVDDVEDDALLVVRELRRAGFDPQYQRVQTQAALSAALEQEWEVVLCDYSMPGFSALEALAFVRQRRLDLPFIIVSGTVGETRAVEIMRAGANDYVFKDNLNRLGVAIERELREARNRAEKRRLQEQLLVSERMASIGVLAAGVVHEISNPLTALLGSAELAVLSFRTSKLALGQAGGLEPVGRELDGVLEAAERIAQIVSDVRLFSRGASQETPGAVDVQPVLESSVRLAMHEAAPRSRIVTEFERTPPVALPASRLGQVFLNLILNAAQAIPLGNRDGNEIRIRTRERSAGWAEIEISDSGCGIPQELRQAIFEPLFTTKAAGAGTGLGLFIAHRIVTDAGGRIEFESEVNEGTTFRVTLPAATQPPDTLEELSTTPCPSSSKTVLSRPFARASYCSLAN